MRFQRERTGILITHLRNTKINNGDYINPSMILENSSRLDRLNVVRPLFGIKRCVRVRYRSREDRLERRLYHPVSIIRGRKYRGLEG